MCYTISKKWIRYKIKIWIYIYIYIYATYGLIRKNDSDYINH